MHTHNIEHAGLPNDAVNFDFSNKKDVERLKENFKEFYNSNDEEKTKEALKDQLRSL